MQRSHVLPCLPGFNFDGNLGRTKFHRVQYFGKIHDGVYYLSEKADVGDHISYPSIYARAEVQELPSWLAYDGQRLMFKAYFQESLQERWKTPYLVRTVIISFFLEDGTMKISEPPVNNSGLEQGVIVRRQRIPMPDPVRYRYYDIIDLNVGKEVEIFGRVYKIVDCDKFTRTFLNRMGMPVPDPLNVPKDPYSELRQFESFPKKPNRKIDTRGDYLKYDKQVLRFYGYWDDRSNLYGAIHHLEIHYYLADSTIEIKEKIPANSGQDSGCMFLRRMKIPKFFVELDPVGASDPYTVLNVMGDDKRGPYYTIDPLSVGNDCKEFYKDNELSIGGEINVFGRKIVITDMDAFTKEYYSKKYGLNDFTPLKTPGADDTICESVEKYVPPYNGFGTYEDSLANCISVLPKAPKADMIKFLYYDKQGLDSHVLRFRAKLISNYAPDEDRLFIIRVFLMDDTISVFELAKRNSGFLRRLFQKRMQVMLPNQETFTSSKPKYYKPEDFYIGARVILNGFCFEIYSADIYALRYMELNCDKFPKSNAKLIIEKLKQILKPVSKEFLQCYVPTKSGDNSPQVLPFEDLRRALYKYAEGKISEHEIITVARHFIFRGEKKLYGREYIRRLVHTEILRGIWNDFERLSEDLNHWDRARTGFLPRDTVFAALRGARIPVDVELINSMLDIIHKNDKGMLDCNDLLKFINPKIDPTPPSAPVNVKMALTQASEEEVETLIDVDLCTFLKELDIKNEEQNENSESLKVNTSGDASNVNNIN